MGCRTLAVGPYFPIIQQRTRQVFKKQIEIVVARGVPSLRRLSADNVGEPANVNPRRGNGRWLQRRERTDAMRTRIMVAGAMGMIIGILGTVGSTLTAQQSVKAPSVMTPHGFIVEEVRVGQSCVVLVFRGGPPTDQVAATPCND